MTNYVPHYSKKKQILARKEEALRRLISTCATSEKLLRAAEMVRDARVRVLLAQRATIRPIDDAQKLYDQIDDRILIIEATSLDSILSDFGYTYDGPSD